jgi:hypothetical protein
MPAAGSWPERQSIAWGSRSRFGTVVLSHALFAKNWPQYELDGLVTREMAGERQSEARTTRTAA